MESLKSLDMNLTDVTDVLVPVYSVLALLFIIAYRMSPETKVEDRYFLKKAVKSTVKKDWREVITGFYHQSDSDGFDDWLKFLDRPFAIRMIAPKMFHKIHIDLTVTDTHVSVERYWSSEKTKGDGERWLHTEDGVGYRAKSRAGVFPREVNITNGAEDSMSLGKMIKTIETNK